MDNARKTAEKILARLGEHRAGKLPVDRQSVPIAELEDLARAYIATSSVGGTLGQTGRLYVSLTAAREYGAAERINGDEEARRELTEILLDAKQTERIDTWRARKRSTGLDITALVAIEGKLLVVTHVTVRDANVGGRRG